MANNIQQAKEIQDALLGAMETMADDYYKKNPKDETISALIIQCLDAESKKYNIRYGITTAVAYGSVSYSTGDKVLVHIPQGDWSNTLTIIGLDKSDEDTSNIDLNLNVDNDTKGYHILGGSLFDMGTGVKHLSENCYDIIYRVNELGDKVFSDANDGDEDGSYTVLQSEMTGTINDDETNDLSGFYSLVSYSDEIEVYSSTIDEENDEGDTSVELDGGINDAMPEDSEASDSIPEITDEIQIIDPNESNAINPSYLVSQETDVFSAATSLYLQADFKVRRDNIDGSFGIVFIFDFKKDDEIYQTPYYFDSSSFKNNPLAFTELTTQGIIVDFNGRNFVRLNKIMIYSQDFSTPDIQIGNIKIYPLKKAEVNDNYMINLSAKNGSWVTNNKDVRYEVKAYYDDCDITPNVDFYWGVESDVQEAGKYHILLGKGYDYIGEGNSCDFYVSNVESRKAKVVCVASYRNKIIAKENIDIFNINHGTLISIAQSKDSNNKTILSCLINGASYYNTASGVESDDDNDAREDAKVEKDNLDISVELRNFIFQDNVDPAVSKDDDADVSVDYTTFLRFDGGWVNDVSNPDSEQITSHNFNKYTFRVIAGRSDTSPNRIDEYMNMDTRNWPVYGFTFNKTGKGIASGYPKQTKTQAFQEITSTLANAVEKKIFDNLKGFKINGTCSVDGKSGTISASVEKEDFCKAEDTKVTITGDTRKAIQKHFIPLKVQVLNEHVISATQNKLDSVVYTEDDVNEDDDEVSSTPSTADGAITIKDEDENEVKVIKNGYVYTNPLNNDKYFKKANGSYVDITDGTCLINEQNPAVVSKNNPLVDGNGEGYLVIENDAAESLSQYYYPDENGQINLDFIPSLVSDDSGDYSTTNWVGLNPDDEDELGQREYSVTLYYNVQVDQEASIKKGAPVIRTDGAGNPLTANPARGEAYVKKEAFTASQDMIFDRLEEVTITPSAASTYTYQWYRGNNITNMHKFMSSSDKKVNSKSLNALLSGGTERYADNAIIIDELGKNEIIGCKVYSSTDGYLGSAYIQL